MILKNNIKNLKGLINFVNSENITNKDKIKDEYIDNLKSIEVIETRYAIDWNKKNIETFTNQQIKNLPFIKNKNFSYEAKKYFSSSVLIHFFSEQEGTFYLLILNKYRLLNSFVVNYKFKKLWIYITLSFLVSLTLFLSIFFLFPFWFVILISLSIFLAESLLIYIYILVKK